jgi:RND superfamily putative drug exporter
LNIPEPIREGENAGRDGEGERRDGDALLPVFLFAVAFGLSTDYGVFLLARIKEARDKGLPNDEAVPVGLERTGRIVTAAALLFSTAVAAFASSQIVFLKELGIGTALAPRPLARLYDRIGVHETMPAQA